MKTIYTSVLALFFSANLSSQTVNQNELNQFYEKQQTPFLENSAEIFVINDVGWQRPYGEREFMLTPLMGDVNAYYSRIKSLDNPIDSIYKSIFSFVRVDVNNQSKSLLQNMSINVPTYIQNEVIVYLPQIDIDVLIQASINIEYLSNYGKQELLKPNIKQNKAVLYYESFESNTIPGNSFVDVAVGANCGWKDVGCVAKSGNWSAWCAGNGSACNSSCSNANYVSNMFSSFTNFPAINTSGYTNMVFSFWMNFTLENVALADYFDFEFDLGSGFQLGAKYTHQSSGHGTNNYVQRAFTINGSPSTFKYKFRMVSDGSWNYKGVYIDDILLTGDPMTDISELDLANSISIYPNPTNGIFSVEAENMESIEITSIAGEIVKQLLVNKNKTTIDLTSFSSGIYFAKIITDKGSAIKKIILN